MATCVCEGPPAARAGTSTTRRSNGSGAWRACACRSADAVNGLGTSAAVVERSVTADILIDELACEAMADWAGERFGLSFIPPGEPLAQRLHRIVQRPGPRRMPQHRHLLVPSPSPGRDQR